MSEYIIQKQTLDDIADAINEKAGTSGQMMPIEMPDKIAAIQTGEDLTALNTEINELDETTGTKTVAQMTTAVGNANTTIDTQGSLLDDVIEALEGKVSPTSRLESKTLTLGASALSTVVPSAGYNGLSSVPVVLDTNVIKAENIAKDVQMLGITGTHAAPTEEPWFRIPDMSQCNVWKSEYVGNNRKIPSFTINFEADEPIGYIQYYNNGGMSSIFPDRGTSYIQKDIESSSYYSPFETSNIPIFNGTCHIIASSDRKSGSITVTQTSNKAILQGEVFVPIVVRNVDGTKYGIIPIFLNALCCMIKGTKITLSNGTQKNIEDITFDDELLVWDFYNGTFASAKPLYIKHQQSINTYNKLTFENNTTLGLVGEPERGYHRIFNKEANSFTYTGTDATPIGTTTFTDNGKEIKLISQEIVNEPVNYYNIITDKHYNLFANGILTSCNASNAYKIKDMKYVGPKLFSIEEYFSKLSPELWIKKEANE